MLIRKTCGLLSILLRLISTRGVHLVLQVCELRLKFVSTMADKNERRSKGQRTLLFLVFCASCPLYITHCKQTISRGGTRLQIRVPAAVGTHESTNVLLTHFCGALPPIKPSHHGKHADTECFLSVKQAERNGTTDSWKTSQRKKEKNPKHVPKPHDLSWVVSPCFA